MRQMEWRDSTDASRAVGHCGWHQLLLARGAKVDAVDSRKGQNALMWAAAEGHADVIDILLKAGADPKLVKQSGIHAAGVCGSKRGQADR